MSSAGVGLKLTLESVGRPHVCPPIPGSESQDAIGPKFWKLSHQSQAPRLSARGRVICLQISPLRWRFRAQAVTYKVRSRYGII